jgi:sterol 3beta-glucosyltransferase
MHLTLLAIGSRGDIQPFVALGAGLRRAGHGVRLATHRNFAALVRGAGLEFAPLEGNTQELTQGAEGRQWLESQQNPLAFMGGFRRLVGPLLRQGMRDGLAAAQGTDAIIFAGPAFYIGHSIAEKLGVPYIQAYLQPLHPTGEFPSALFPLPFEGGRVFNYATHMAAGMGFWGLMRPVVNAARRDFLGLPPLSRAGPFAQLLRERRPVLYGYSPALLPKPRSWPDFIHVTGFWFLDQGRWAALADLEAFLDDGPPPVYIGFGSMVGSDPARLTEAVLGALSRSGARGLLLSGWGGLAQADLPESIFQVEHAPHGWLFPRVAAVVHHGGAGTTAAGLRAGRPTVIVPFFGDQPFWGRIVAARGVGPQPIRTAGCASAPPRWAGASPPRMAWPPPWRSSSRRWLGRSPSVVSTFNFQLSK